MGDPIHASTNLETVAMARPINPVILSGGKGMRLWPISRPDHPKQLLPLVTPRTMLQETTLRVAGRADFAQPLVICQEDQRMVVDEQLRQIECTPNRIVLEPVGRNTAPPAAVAALLLAESDSEALILLLPADHVVGNVPAMIDAVARGAAAARQGKLVTFGIRANRPEAGYGYIRRGDALPHYDGCFAIDQFVEKPDRDVAEQYVASGQYFWNSGMFLFRADRFLAELAEAQPKVLDACQAAWEGKRADGTTIWLPGSALEACPAISVDHAVMEHTSHGTVVPVDMGWSDIGTWDSLWKSLDRDKDGNVISGPVVASDVSNCLLRSDGPELVVAGLRNCVVVATNDAVLVCPMDHAQHVKALVDQITDQG